jgi:hypothetical protein
MIWFTCKCGKTHGRPENSIGTMVFCECGHGNRVPWESTAPEPPPQVPSMAPAMPSMPSSAPPRTPILAPLSFDGASGAAQREETPVRRRGERRDPGFCFNHASVPRSASCQDCGESFCSSCLVAMDEAMLCAPCKNFRVRGLEMPPRSSGFATSSLLLALFAGGILGFCLLPFSGSSGVGVLSLLALLPQLAALALGVRALFLSEQSTRFGGQSLAITGVTTAAVCVLLTLLLNLYALRA